MPVSEIYVQSKNMKILENSDKLLSCKLIPWLYSSKHIETAELKCLLLQISITCNLLSSKAK